MVPYFIWNGVDSRDVGIEVVEYPPIMRAPERVKTVTIPGRSGVLTLLEGEHVYDPYTRAMTIANRPGVPVDRVTEFLRGSGWIIFGNDPEYAYEVRFQPQMQLEKLHRGIWQGSVQMYTQPLKRLAVPISDIALTTSGTTVFNPGAVMARPLLVITTTAACSLTIGSETMSVSNSSATFKYDCETGLFYTSAGVVTTSLTVTGGITGIPTGTSTVSWTGATGVTITPRWRFV